jgi:hypothetical protein
MEIIKTAYGYMLCEKKVNKIALRIISIIILVFIGLGIIIIDFNELNFIVGIIFRTITFMVILLKIYEIIFLHTDIKIFKDRIVFHIHSKLLISHKIEIKRDDIKEISINYEIEHDEGGIIYYYNLDLIDKIYNAYRLNISTDYNNIYNYGMKIAKILDLKFVDKSYVEGYGNIYNKRII